MYLGDVAGRSVRFPFGVSTLLHDVRDQPDVEATKHSHPDLLVEVDAIAKLACFFHDALRFDDLIAILLVR